MQFESKIRLLSTLASLSLSFFSHFPICFVGSLCDSIGSLFVFDLKSPSSAWLSQVCLCLLPNTKTNRGKQSRKNFFPHIISAIFSWYTEQIRKNTKTNKPRTKTKYAIQVAWGHKQNCSVYLHMYLMIYRLCSNTQFHRRENNSSQILSDGWWWWYSSRVDVITNVGEWIEGLLVRWMKLQWFDGQR